jgi:hypothetical protein
MSHRISEDFDFFRTDGFSANRLHEILRQAGDVETLQEDDRTLTVIVSTIKVSFFSVPDEFLFPGQALSGGRPPRHRADEAGRDLGPR